MAQLGNLIVKGVSRFVGKITAKDIEASGTITGNLTGTASKATADASGNVITSTYAKKPVTYTATISTSWSGSSAPYIQTVTVNGILSTDNPIVDVVLSSTLETAKGQEKAWACVSRIVTSANTLTVYCNTKKPTTAIPIQLKVVR